MHWQKEFPLGIFSPESSGWTRLATDEYSGSLGTLWISGEPGSRRVGLQGNPGHANGNLGVVHGGVMLGFADVALGCAVADALGGTFCATAQLQYQFAGAARIADFIVCEPELVRKTSQMVFVRGLMMVEDRVVGSADAIFKVLDPEKMKRIKQG